MTIVLTGKNLESCFRSLLLCRSDSCLFLYPERFLYESLFLYRLQAHALSRTQPHLPPPSHPPPSSTFPPSFHHTSPSQQQNHTHYNDPDADIARWIEERNILLQTGVYTHSDPTIQKLDKKIREALVAKSSHEEEQSSSY